MESIQDDINMLATYISKLYPVKPCISKLDPLMENKALDSSKLIPSHQKFKLNNNNSKANHTMPSYSQAY